MATTTTAHPILLNWDVVLETDPRALAQHATVAARLASLTFAGLRARIEQIGPSTDDLDEELLDELVRLTDLLCFTLARRLGVEQGVA